MMIVIAPSEKAKFVLYNDGIAVCMRCGHVITTLSRTDNKIQCKICNAQTSPRLRCMVDKPCPAEIAKNSIAHRDFYKGTPVYDGNEMKRLAEKDYEYVVEHDKYYRHDKPTAIKVERCEPKPRPTYGEFQCIYCDEWFPIKRKNIKRAVCPHCEMGQIVAWHEERLHRSE